MQPRFSFYLRQEFTFFSCFHYISTVLVARKFFNCAISWHNMLLSQLYKRIELGRGYVVNFEVDWNYKQFIDTLELEQHMGITEVGIPMPPKVRKRSTQNSNRKNNGAA